MPKAPPLHSEDEMYRALIERNTNYEGLFFFGVKSTGIFCRPDCPAKKPKRQNISFYRTVSDALAAGFRPCKRCQPLHTSGDTPEWLSPILNLVEQNPTKRWTDTDLRNCKVEPTRIRRWFKKNHGMTFHAFLRLQRLSTALGQLQSGSRAIYASETNGYGSAAGLREGLKKWLGDYPTQLKHIEPIFVNRILTPLGPMVAAASDSGLCLLEFADRRMLSTQFKRVGRLFSQPITPGDHALFAQTQQELNEYFEGTRHTFNVPIRYEGSEFQMSVWQALQKIPYGQTVSYENLARSINHPQAQRAVGRANGDNRFAIIIPCHRVIRADGTLSGYGGGIWRKQHLLNLEQENVRKDHTTSKNLK